MKNNAQHDNSSELSFNGGFMNQLFSILRLSAILLAMIVTTAHATSPGTITPEQDDTVQQEQNGDDDGFIEEEEQDDGFQNDEGQDQDEYDGYGDEQDQGDNWGDDNQGDDGYDRGQDDDQDDDGYDRGQDGKNQDDGYRPGKPGRDQGKPRYDRRPRRLVETVNVYQQYFGGARFPLYMMVNNLQRFRGYRLVNVVINGSSDAGMGMAVFCASQCSPMQNVGYYRTAYPIRTTGERINHRSAQWFLELRGNFWIESIQLEFVRR